MRFRALVLTDEDLQEADDLYRQGGMFKRSAPVVKSDQHEELRVWGLTLGMTL